MLHSFCAAARLCVIWAFLRSAVGCHPYSIKSHWDGRVFYTNRYALWSFYSAMGMVWYREEDEHPVLLVQPAVFHGQAHAVQQDTVQGLGIG